MKKFTISECTQLSVCSPPFIRRYRGASGIRMGELSSWHLRTWENFVLIACRTSLSCWSSVTSGVEKVAHLFFFPLSCSFCVLELDLWADFQRFLLLSEAHSDNRPVYLSFAFRCLGEGVIAVYKSDFFLFFKFYLFFGYTACGILVPQPGIKAMPPALEVWSLNHWTTREVPSSVISLTLELLSAFIWTP